jgi:hypothetical protein
MVTAIQLLSAVRCKLWLWARIASLVLFSLSLKADSKALSCFSNALLTAFSVLSACSFDLCSKAVANREISLIQRPSQSHRFAALRVGNTDAGLGLACHLETDILEGGHDVRPIRDHAALGQGQQAVGDLALRLLFVARQVRRCREGPLVGRVVGVVQGIAVVRERLPGVHAGPVGPIVVRLQALAGGQLGVGDDEVQL